MAVSFNQTESQLIFCRSGMWTSKTAAWYCLVLLFLAGWTVRMVMRLGVMTLTCDRPESQQVQCVKSQTRLMGLLQQPDQHMTQVERVRLEVTTQGQGYNQHSIYHTFLVSPEQTLPIARTEASSSAMVGRRRALSQQQAIAAQIERYLASTEPRLHLVHDTRFDPTLYLKPLWVSLWIGAIMFLLLSSTERKIILDKAANQLIIETVPLFARRRYSLEHFAGTAIHISKSGGGSCFYRLVLHPKPGQSLEVMTARTDVQLKAVQSKVTQFLQFTAP